MLSYAIIGLAVLLGYLVTVTISLVGTMGIASGVPQFVAREARLRTPYKLAHETLWFLGATTGGFVASMAGMGVYVWKAELGLSVILLFMLWRNTWEARQRGTAHQILISILTIVGVFSGYALQKRF